MCGSKRPGRGCTSARCVNGDEDEELQTITHDDVNDDSVDLADHNLLTTILVDHDLLTPVLEDHDLFTTVLVDHDLLTTVLA